MLHKSRRTLSLFLAVLMAVGMTAVFALPELTDVSAAADPYARINATDAGEGVFVPGENVYFVNTAWASAAPAADGEAFTVTYGDGSAWGNGVTYRLTYGVNALSSWKLVSRTLRHLDPATHNNPVFVFFPGQQYSTANADPEEGIASDGSSATLSMITPASLSTAAEADYMNAWLLGPQAGKSPVTAKGSVTVANGRTVNNTKEFVFKSTFWGLKNGIINADGFAADAAFKLYSENTSTAANAYVTGFHLDNWYVDLNTTGGAAFLSMGGNNKTNLILSVATITNSYFVQSVRDNTSQAPVLQNNYTLIDNCVFKDFKVSATDQYKQNQHIKFSVPAYSAATGTQKAFLGSYAGKYSAAVTNCTFYDWTSSHIVRINFNNMTSYGANAAFTFDNNIITFSGGEEETGAGDFFYLDKVESSTACGALFNVTDNDIMISSVDMEAGYAEKVVQGNSGYNIVATIRGNVIRGDFKKINSNTQYVSNPFASFITTTDLSGNLFIDYDGTVHAAHGSTTGVRSASNYFTVKTDVYASDEMKGGIAELFTVQETKGDLFVTNCHVVTINGSNAGQALEADGLVKASVVVMPLDGVTYDTKDLFVYNNDGVEFLGVYANESCTTPVSTLEKGFGTLYAKARYATANTTCTVRYTITEPTVFRVVDVSSVGVYDFNGDTYESGKLNGVTNANVIFYTSLSAAYNAVTKPTHSSVTPMTDVILLMPGAIAVPGTGFNKSCAIIGPKFGVSPTAPGSTAVQNGRSLTDTTSEAKLNAQLQIGFIDRLNSDNTQNIYFAVAGVASATTRFLRIDNNTLYTAVNGSKDAVAVGADTNWLYFINAQDSYNNASNNAGHFLYCDNKATTEASHVEPFLYANRCYVDSAGRTGTSSSFSYVVSTGRYVTQNFKNCTFANLQTYSRINYLYPTNQVAVACRIASPSLIVRDCTVGAATTNNADYYFGYIYDTRKDPAKFNSADYKSVKVILDGNVFYNSLANKDILRIHPDIDGTTDLTVTNNTYNCTGGGGSRFINLSNYYRADGQDKSMLLKSATVTGNVVINHTDAHEIWAFDDPDDPGVNSVNVDDNFYLKNSGADLVAVPYAASGTTEPEYAWMDTGRTYTNADFALAAGGFDTVEPGDDLFSWTATGTDAKTAADIAFADPSVTVVGMYYDFEASAPAASIESGDTVYVKAQKGSVKAVFTLSYISHNWGEWTIAEGDEATCSKEGKQTRVCLDCGKVQEQTIPMAAHTPSGAWVLTTEPTCVDKGEETMYCTVCQAAVNTRPVDETGIHTPADEWVHTVEPDCLNDGTEELLCSVCGASLDSRVVPSTGEHNFVSEILTPATCTTDGSVKYTCTGCHTTHTEVIPKTGHQYRAEVTKAATCVEDGTMTYTCTVCTDTYDEPIPSNGSHEWGDWQVTQGSTCTVPGSRRHTCTRCGTTETEQLALAAHIYDTEFTIDIKPTGSVRGEKSRHCIVCGDARTDITDMGYCQHEHISETWVVDKEASCTEEGRKHQVCTDCDDEINVTVIEKIPHEFVSISVVNDATCTTDGEEIVECTVCHHSEPRAIPATGHTLGKWTVITPATCTAAGSEQRRCTVCEALLASRSVPATGHKTFAWIVLTPATCTGEGEKVHACTECGDFDESQIIPAAGHRETFRDIEAPTCTEAGVREYTCAVCGNVRVENVAATGHTPSAWRVVKPATSLSAGERQKVCTVCGKVLQKEAIDKLDTINSAAKFKDVGEKDWFKPAVDFVVSNGLFAGTTNTTFSPNMPMSRAMIVTVLGRMDGVNTADYKVCQFQDVKDGSYYYAYVEWARQKGIVSGIDRVTFAPDRDITRQEICKVMVDFCKYKGVTLRKDNAAVTFKDASKISSWARSYVTTCQRAGIISGSDGYIRPLDSATRAECASIFMNFYKNYLS